MERDTMQKKDFKNRNVFSIFISYFGPHKKLFIIDMLCAVCVAGIDLVYPLVSRKAMYDMLPNKAYTAFFTVMAIVIAAYVLRSVFQFIITYWGHIFGVRVEADIRKTFLPTCRLSASTSLTITAQVSL